MARKNSLVSQGVRAHVPDRPYRLLIEQMNEGALTLAADKTILYANRRFAGCVLVSDNAQGDIHEGRHPAERGQKVAERGSQNFQLVIRAAGDGDEQ